MLRFGAIILLMACKNGDETPQDDTSVPDTVDTTTPVDTTDTTDTTDTVDTTDTPEVDTTDTTEVDTTDTTPPADRCVWTASSTLPGVQIAGGDAPCVLTVADADLGVDAPFTVTVVDPVTAALDQVGCGGTDANGLRFALTLSSVDGSYCPRCDEGHCQNTPINTTTVVGGWPDTFRWLPRAWSGPSDFGNVPGDLLPAGEYELLILATGALRNGTPWEVRLSAPVTLLP